MTYDNWIQPLRPLSLSGDIFIIQAPTTFLRDWIQQHFLSDITQALTLAASRQIQVSILVNEKLSTLPQALTPQAQTPASQIHIAHKSMPAAQPEKGLPLSSHLTFQTFVEGGSNRFAMRAAQAVADRPAKAYNPFIIYGETGLGKTHLLQAIAHEIAEQSRNLTYIFISAERFMNEFTKSIQLKTMANFRQIFRNVDVLLIDDVQFWDDVKVSTQSEFFYTFHDLYYENKQIIATSDLHPAQSQLNDRLKSRFEMGLVVEIFPPDLETRIAILHQKAMSLGFSLPNDVSIFIANKIQSNIRALEGALNRVYFQAQDLAVPLSMDLAQEALKHLTASKPKQINIQNIQRVVASHFDITTSQMLAISRRRNIVLPRQISMYLSRKLTKASLPEIGDAFNGKDHTTVLHALKKIEALIHNDPSIQTRIDSITQELSS